MGDANKYPPQSGRIIGEDGQTHNVVDLLGGDMPVSDEVHDIRRYAPRSGRVIGEDGYVYSLVDLLQNAGGGGSPVGPTDVDWAAVKNKPTSFPPSEHNHDNRYYTQEQIDSPGFLSSRIDNQTIQLQSGELRVMGVDGMMSPSQINALLAGGAENIPGQISDIYMTIAALSAGMRYRGKFETHAELLGVGNMDGGDLAVVLADESRGGVRSMYVYNETLGFWDFVGSFEFSDSFTALTDTPSNFEEGKVLRSGVSSLFYDDVRWSEVNGRPDRTKTQIEGAVDTAHSHSNGPSLDRIGVDTQGRVTVDGVPYVPAVQTKQRLFAYRSGSDQTLTAGTDCVFNSRLTGDIPYDTSTGIFTLEGGKTYRVMVEGSLYTSGYVILTLIDTETNVIANSIARGIWMDVNPSTTSWHESSAGPLKTYVTPTATRGYKIRATSVSGDSRLRNTYMSLEVVEI